MTYAYEDGPYGYDDRSHSSSSSSYYRGRDGARYGHRDPQRGGSNLVHGRYQLLTEAGRGNFAKVYRAVDTQSNSPVALKMLQAEYRRDAQFELQVLSAVSRNDPHGQSKVCKLLHHFDWQGCPCFVMPLYGPSLSSRRLGVRNCGRSALQRLTKQLGRALRYLHFDCRLVHTDLKPENILLDTDPKGADGIGNNWTIVDLGSSSFFNERPDQDLITTRPYRAVEAVVGAPWSYQADMWSVGTIIYEVYVGQKLFNAVNDPQHLMMMQIALGRIPAFVSQQASNQGRRMFDHEGNFRPIGGVSCPGLSYVQSDPEVCDLITRLLNYDPAMRMRADEMVHHPFCANASSTQDPAPLSRLPASPYSSQQISTPGTRYLAQGGQRPRPDRILAPAGRRG